MECNDVKNKLFEYIDNELDEIEREEIERHLVGCKNCKREYELCKKLLSSLNKMIDEEPPKGYCKRLHAKLLEAKQQMKIKKMPVWKKYGSIAAALVLIVAVIAFPMINSRTNENKSADRAEISPGASPNTSQNFSMSTGGGDTAELKSDGAIPNITAENNSTIEPRSAMAVNQRQAKLFKVGDISVETKNYDEFIGNLTTAVSQFSGYIEENNTDINTYQSNKFKIGYLKLRVPQDSFYDVVSFIESSSNINHKNITETDVTKEYYEKENRMLNLQIQETNLRELFDKAQTVADMLQIENELNRIRTEIEALNIDLSSIDDKVNMSVITISVTETPSKGISITNKDNLWDRAKEGFINTVNSAVEIGENIIVLLVSVVPIAIPIAIIIAVIIIIKRRKNK